MMGLDDMVCNRLAKVHVHIGACVSGLDNEKPIYYGDRPEGCA